MTSAGSPQEASRPPARERILSVDALRGFDMFWIIGAGGLVQALSKLGDSSFLRAAHDQLDHKDWEGFACLDLVFPLFIFLAGMSIVFSLPGIVQRSGRAAAYRRIVTRTLSIFLLGFFYYGGFSKRWPEIRLLGVLQRIAICYFFTSVLYLNLDLKKLAVACAAILLGYWAALALVPVPGAGAGCFEPGKNLANYLDAQYLPGWKWDGAWDPEGLLGTFPAISTCILGVFAAAFLAKQGISRCRKAACLFAVGAAAVALGFFWGQWFPVIKKIWTSSYVLVAGGYSCLLLAAFYTMVDILQFRGWAQPFIWIGANPLALYMADDILNFEALAKRIAGGDIQASLGVWGDIFLYLVSVGLMLALARFLYKRRIFLRA
jgi:predicted acyltransferase